MNSKILHIQIKFSRDKILLKKKKKNFQNSISLMENIWQTRVA